MADLGFNVLMFAPNFDGTCICICEVVPVIITTGERILVLGVASKVRHKRYVDRALTISCPSVEAFEEVHF